MPITYESWRRWESTEGQGWATDMADLPQRHLATSARRQGRGRPVRPRGTADARYDYQAIIAAGHQANPPVMPTVKPGRPKRSKPSTSCCASTSYTDDVLRFATDFSVPFDNNLCERDIRMVKIAQKISGGFRSTEGAEAFLALRSYLSTAAKQGVNRLEVLQRLFNGDPWMPATPTAHV